MEIQFVGEAGITQSCVNAVLRYFQFNDILSKVLIITCNQSHALILYTEDNETIAIRSGFSSGYQGDMILTGYKRLESAFRNPRAHREIKEDSKTQLLEFMALNHLFTIESTSRLRLDKSQEQTELNIEADTHILDNLQQ